MQALSQTNGKGTHGRKWLSPKGGLYMSILLKPNCHANKVGELSLMTATAISNAVPNSIVKWPNDVFLDGKKCAGVLAQSELDGSLVKWILIGVGVNIKPVSGNSDFSSIGGEIDAKRDRILSEIDRLYAPWKLDNLASLR